MRPHHERTARQALQSSLSDELTTRTGAYDRFVSRYVALDWTVGRDEPGQIKMDGYGGLCLDAGNSESPTLSVQNVSLTARAESGQDGAGLGVQLLPIRSADVGLR